MLVHCMYIVFFQCNTIAHKTTNKTRHRDFYKESTTWRLNKTQQTPRRRTAVQTKFYRPYKSWTGARANFPKAFVTTQNVINTSNLFITSYLHYFGTLPNYHLSLAFAPLPPLLQTIPSPYNIC